MKATRNNRSRKNRSTRKAKKGGLFGMSSTESQLNTIRKLAYESRNASAIRRLRSIADYIDDTVPFSVDPTTLYMYKKNPTSYYKVLKSDPMYSADKNAFKEYVGATMRR
jgi:hypothetical protein